MTAFDSHTNLAVSAVLTAPSPATSGLSLTLTSGGGALFPSAGAFNIVIWPAGANSTNTNAEIARVASVSGDTLTLSARGPLTSDPGGINRTVIIGDQVQLADTRKLFTDIETAVNLRAFAMFMG